MAISDEKFRRPTQFVQEQDRFGANEVGLNHPNNQSFLRIRNNGDIEIVAGERCSIIMSPSTSTIAFVADNIKFLTKENGGLRWNNLLFNQAADSFNEPSFVPAADHETFGLYKGVEQFIYDEQNEDAPIVANDIPADIAAVLYKTRDRTMPETMVNDPETGETISYRTYYTRYGKPPPFGSGAAASG